MWEIGATPEHVAFFMEDYRSSHRSPPRSASEVHSEGELLALRGRVTNFAGARDFLEREISTHGVESVVLHYLPSLLGGMGAQALHPIIHLGYALETGHPTLVAEGLADHVYRSHRPTLMPRVGELEPMLQSDAAQVSSLEVMGILQELRSSGFAAKVAKASRLWQSPGNDENAFLKRMATAVEKPELRSVLVDAVSRVRLPATQDGVEHFLLRSSLVAYAMTERTNDFFLLHGVTSSWAMSRVLRRISNNSTLQEMVLRDFLAGCLLPAYAAQGCPKFLDAKRLPRPSDLAFLDEAKGRALEPSILDEHVYKLITAIDEACQRWPGDDFLLRLAKKASKDVFGRFRF